MRGRGSSVYLFKHPNLNRSVDAIAKKKFYKEIRLSRMIPVPNINDEIIYNISIMGE